MAERPQSYADHVHRPRLFIVGMTFWLIAVILLVIGLFGRDTFAAVLLFMLAAVCCSLLMCRTYITRLQDRVIRAEMRARCSQLLTASQMLDLNRLSLKQLVALRFASDAELAGLLARVSKDRLTPDQIKKAVVNWVPDYDRA